MNYVQSYICNLSFPKTLEEVLYYLEDEGRFNIELLLDKEDCEWTAPKWCKNDDIVLFMHAKTSINTIRSLKKKLLNSKSSFSLEEYNTIATGLEKGVELYDLYGGKVFAIGKVNGRLVYDDFANENNLHWKSRIYAPVEDIYILQKPISTSEFIEFIEISRQSAITPVFGEKFDKLKKLILEYNNAPEYFSESVAANLPLSKINIDNWLTVSNLYRRSFFLEIQFRTFYTNYLLKTLGDRKTIYSECACYKNKSNPSFVDNVIYINGKYLPVEVKLHSSSERNLMTQLKKYCNVDKLMIDSKKQRIINDNYIYKNFVLLIDTFSIFIYNSSTDSLINIYNLDDIKTTQDILKVKNIIISYIK